MLNQIVEKLGEPAIFWLDGHYSGGITSLGKKETPILEELRIICQKDLSHVILIDDDRFFNGTEGYPTLEEMKKYISRIRPDCDIKISDDCIQVVLN